MSRFEVGSAYQAYQAEYGAVTVLRRTDKTIWVKSDDGIEWSMRVKHDKEGNEYAVDTSVPSRWREAFTYYSWGAF